MYKYIYMVRNKIDKLKTRYKNVKHVYIESLNLSDCLLKEAIDKQKKWRI